MLFLRIVHWSTNLLFVFAFRCALNQRRLDAFLRGSDEVIQVRDLNSAREVHVPPEVNREHRQMIDRERSAKPGRREIEEERVEVPCAKATRQSRSKQVEAGRAGLWKPAK